MKRHMISAALSLLVFTLLLGIVYPLAVTGLAALAFPAKATGSLLFDGGPLGGSALIGQPFSNPGYFWGRPSATAPFPDNPALSAGSNLGPTNPILLETVQARVDALRAADPGNTASIPVDLVTASGSGLDPDISPAAAFYQVPRVARTRGLPEDSVRDLVTRIARGRQLGILGEPSVNVLELNLALDALAGKPLGAP